MPVTITPSSETTTETHALANTNIKLSTPEEFRELLCESGPLKSGGRDILDSFYIRIKESLPTLSYDQVTAYAAVFREMQWLNHANKLVALKEQEIQPEIKVYTSYDGIKVTETKFPAEIFKEQLAKTLGKLGEIIEIEQPTYNGNIDTFSVRVLIKFNQDIPIVDTSSDSGKHKYLHINSTAGGCFMRGIDISCYQTPSPERRIGVFLIECKHNSMTDGNLPPNIKTIRTAINDFANKAACGITYSFGDDRSRNKQSS